MEEANPKQTNRNLRVAKNVTQQKAELADHDFASEGAVEVLQEERCNAQALQGTLGKLKANALCSIQVTSRSSGGGDSYPVRLQRLLCCLDTTRCWYRSGSILK